jgi:hypothetical protein
MPPEAKHDPSRHEPLPKHRQSKAVDQSSEQSFPASDPPGTHLPDVPPSNVDAKWEAAKKLHRDRNTH